MPNQMHIVNGDSTREILEQSGIEGEIVVWRELLSDGPVSEPVFSDEFWQEAPFVPHSFFKSRKIGRAKRA